MKARHLYLLPALFMMIWAAPSCSDNIDDDGLKPTANERFLNIETEGKTTSDGATAQPIRFDFDSGSKNILVKVTSNTLWKVEVSGDGGCSVDVARGQGDGEFHISVPNNRGEERYSKISVTLIDGEGNIYNNTRSAEIEITQQGSQVYITPSSLDVFPAENARDQEFDIVANAEWTLSVRPESELTGNFITIIPIEGMTEVEGSPQTFTGTANASFRISLQNNGTAVVRKAYIELKSENGNYSVEISQQRSEYSFDVSPNSTRFVGPLGETLNFSVYSPNDGWTIIPPEVGTGEDVWINCPDSHFDKNDSRVPVSVTVEPNISGRERTGTIYFKSDNVAYEPVPVVVVQSGFDLTFAISSADASEVVMEHGGSVSFDLDSRFNWYIETPTWLSADYPEGISSTSASRITLKIEPNPTNSNRTGTVTVYPRTTYFQGLEIDPEKVGVNPLRFSVTQFGGREPAISVPWLRDGYTQTSATVEYNFYSPYYRVVEAGLEYRRDDAGSVTTMTVTPSDATEGTASFELTGLDPASKYVTRGYVKDEEGNVKYGDWSYPFTTAGQYPSNDDNPRPEF